MRTALALSGLLVLASFLSAQEPEQKQQKPTFPVKIERVRLGFRDSQNESAQFKVGMWTPVFVDVTAGAKGVASKNPQDLYLEFTCNDSEGVGASYRVPLTLLPNASRTVVGYIKPGNYDAASKVSVTLHWDGNTFHPRQEPIGAPLLDLGGHLYLSLGSKTTGLLDSFARKDPLENVEAGPRHAVYETDALALPEHWFGYQGIDLIILSTDRKDFLTELLRDAKQERLQALAQWVRHGGRLIIPVHYATQDLLAALLQAPAWQPAVPVMPPANPGDVTQSAVRRLEDVEQWARTNGQPFPAPGEKPVPIARLSPGQVPGGFWNVLAKTADGRPLITKMPYGRGSIVYMAFSLDQPPFAVWAGRQAFLKQMIDLLAPQVNEANNQNVNVQGWRGDVGDDITSGLQRTLDNFDVSVIDFGYVALFIILYILVVGPLDYFVLKYVFNKLEWTWITFPTVVLAVSVAAYFTAYALKGHDLKINKVDVVDFDLRTQIDDRGKTQRAFAYGQTFFTILSPRIQNYTVGVDVQPGFWNGSAEKPLSTYEISWLGRPDRDGPGAMGRSGSQGFFRRPYAFAKDDKGLEGVPIPVWTTKSLTASWEAALPKIPFEADLEYLPPGREIDGKNVVIIGTIKNNLPVDLEDVWLTFDGTFFPIAEGLKAGAGPVKLFLRQDGVKNASEWVSPNNHAGQEAVRDADFQSVQGSYDPTALIRQAMFYERSRQPGMGPDHSLRFFDLSWRLTPPEGQRQTPLREAVLYGHVPFQRGAAQTLQEGQRPLPTSIWLGRLPEPGEPRPALPGAMAQDTYLRVLLPVRLHN